MTTSSFSTRVRHDDNPTFREWGLEFATALSTVGMVQTADTGQINWTTVTRAGSNSEAGYEVWRFNDSLQGTAPIYFRVGYGTGSSANVPRIQITVGTGSDGAGAITGTALTTARSIHGSSAQTTDTARQSYFCAVAGFLGLNWKVGSSNTEASFFICRTCDSNGAATVTGAMVHWGAGSSNGADRQALRFAATAVAYAAQTSTVTAALGLNPQSRTESSVGADLQVFLGWTIAPEATPLFAVCGVITGEITAGSTFSTTLVGNSARTFLVWSAIGGPFGPIGAASLGGLSLAMVWE